MKVYGAEICVDCRNYKAIQEKRGFEAEYIDITESTKGNLELYAKWASDTKTEQPKKKCGKKSALMINLLSAASLLVVCLKKKK